MSASSSNTTMVWLNVLSSTDLWDGMAAAMAGMDGISGESELSPRLQTYDEFHKGENGGEERGARAWEIVAVRRRQTVG